MATTELRVDRLGAIIEEGLDLPAEVLYVVNPAEASIEAVVRAVVARTDPPTVRLFVDEQTLKNVLDDFLTASRLADLTAAGAVAVRTLREVPRSSLLLTDETLLTIVEGDETVTGLAASTDEFVTETYDHYRRRWKRADVFSLRTPPLSEVRETIATEIGENARTDLDAILEILDTTDGDGGLDEVTIALLVAANNRELLYDISRWGEDINLASKATFSRVKTDLEEAGIIATEKVPIEVGRPRLRLVFGAEELREADVETVVEQVERRFAR
jgi:hypothetical protein